MKKLTEENSEQADRVYQLEMDLAEVSAENDQIQTYNVEGCELSWETTCVHDIHLFQWKKKLLIQQQEREKEQSDHATMLKELQKLLAEERMAKENLEHEVFNPKTQNFG